MNKTIYLCRPNTNEIQQVMEGIIGRKQEIIITTYGLNYNKYSHIVQNTVTIDDLFT